jgi:hypothetical protein
MIWEVGGPLVIVQGSIECALDIIEDRSKWRYQKSATSATNKYSFSQIEIGKVEILKTRILPQGKMELKSDFASSPTDKWLVKYLLTKVVPNSISESLQSLLSVYIWQIEKNLFDLTSAEYYKMAVANSSIDWGWENLS